MRRLFYRLRSAWNAARIAAATFCIVAALLLAAPPLLPAQSEKPAFTPREKPLAQQIAGLRALPDDVRARATKQLALDIRQLPASPTKRTLALNLANLSTEGDFGHDTLQEVATTLANALRERPVPRGIKSLLGQPAPPYIELAELVRYEHVQATLDDPQFAAATAKLEADDARRQNIDFTLTDLAGKSWELNALRGKVVLVNFWATWCPPCRKEMPDLEALYTRFAAKGFVILAISDEEADKVKPFLAERNITYPVMLDPGRKVNDLFQVAGIPKSFVYDRSGKMVAQSIDMRTQRQFFEMLAQAGLQ